METHDVVIIGAGPAGIAAAIQLRRYDIEPPLFEQEQVGGLLRNAHLVENYPGFPEGITGPELASLMRDHLGLSGVEARHERVISLDYRHRVFYEVYPIRDIRHKNIAIIGAGDAAFDYALNLARQNEVTMLSRGASARCSQSLWERASSSLHISHIRNVVVRKVLGRAGKLLVSCGHMDRSDVTTVTVDYLVIAVGRDPATHFFTRSLDEQSAYLALADRLYMIGDVRNSLYRQASISVGNGVEAAMRIARHLGA